MIRKMRAIARRHKSQEKDTGEVMDMVLLNPIIALVAGILILLVPRILNYVIAIYLIAIGLIGLSHHLQ